MKKLILLVGIIFSYSIVYGIIDGGGYIGVVTSTMSGTFATKLELGSTSQALTTETNRAIARENAIGISTGIEHTAVMSSFTTTQTRTDFQIQAGTTPCLTKFLDISSGTTITGQLDIKLPLSSGTVITSLLEGKLSASSGTTITNLLDTKLDNSSATVTYKSQNDFNTYTSSIETNLTVANTIQAYTFNGYELIISTIRSHSPLNIVTDNIDLAGSLKIQNGTSNNSATHIYTKGKLALTISTFQATAPSDVLTDYLFAVSTEGKVNAVSYYGNGANLTGLSSGAGVAGSTACIIFNGGGFCTNSKDGVINTVDEYDIAGTSQSVDVTIFVTTVNTNAQKTIPINDYYSCTDGFTLYFTFHSTQTGSVVFNIDISSDASQPNYTTYSTTITANANASFTVRATAVGSVYIPYTSFTNNYDGKMQITRVCNATSGNTLNANVYLKNIKMYYRRRY